MSVDILFHRIVEYLRRMFNFWTKCFKNNAEKGCFFKYLNFFYFFS